MSSEWAGVSGSPELQVLPKRRCPLVDARGGVGLGRIAGGLCRAVSANRTIVRICSILTLLGVGDVVCRGSRLLVLSSCYFV